MQFLLFAALILGATFLGKNKIEAEILGVSDDFTRWDGLFQKYGSRSGVHWFILKAICMNESSLGRHPRVARGLEVPTDIDGSKSEDGKSWGLMQLTLPTANDFENVDVIDLNNPETSVRIASDFLASLMRQFPGQLEYVVKSYNQGAGNTRKEIRGEIEGYAQEYWERFQSNYDTVNRKQGG